MWILHIHQKRDTEMDEKTPWAPAQMAASAFVTLIVYSAVGFNWISDDYGFGFKTAGSAGAMVREAVEDRLASICVANSNADPDGFKAFEAAASDHDRRQQIEKFGWARIPGDKEVASSAVYACAKKLVSLTPKTS